MVMVENNKTSSSTHYDGSLIARYTYDTWGNTISIVDASGNEITSSTALPVQNPFRYRGYYFDSESGLYYLQSRYYDPVTCRFVNADSLVDANSGIIGNNLYIYAANNPVNNSDPTGHGIFLNIIKGFVNKVIKPIVDVFKKILDKLVNGTRSAGVNVNAAFGVQYTLSVGIAYDGKGNIGYAFSSGPGGGTPNASVGVYTTITNAPNIKKLEGYSAQAGGSVSVGCVSVGVEPTIFSDSESNDLYSGISLSISGGPPIPAEIHGDITNTKIISVNIFELYYNIYNTIMEW